MATLTQKGVEAVRLKSGGPVVPMHFNEAASQTFKKGEAVYLSSGQVTEFNAAADDGSTRLLGFAAEDASGTTDTRIAVWVADDQTIFKASLFHDTAASAISARSDIGSLWPLEDDTTNSKHYVDKGNPGSKIDACRIVGLVSDVSDDEAVGDQYAQVLFIIDHAARQFGRDA